MMNSKEGGHKEVTPQSTSEKYEHREDYAEFEGMFYKKAASKTTSEEQMCNDVEFERRLPKRSSPQKKQKHRLRNKERTKLLINRPQTVSQAAVQKQDSKRKKRIRKRRKKSTTRCSLRTLSRHHSPRTPGKSSLD